MKWPRTHCRAKWNAKTCYTILTHCLKLTLQKHALYCSTMIRFHIRAKCSKTATDCEKDPSRTVWHARNREKTKVRYKLRVISLAQTPLKMDGAQVNYLASCNPTVPLAGQSMQTHTDCAAKHFSNPGNFISNSRQEPEFSKDIKYVRLNDAPDRVFPLDWWKTVQPFHLKLQA